MRTVRAFAFLATLALSSLALADGARFRIRVDPALTSAPVSGRLVISIIRPAARLPADADPNDAPFWNDPQPMFGIDIHSLAADKPSVVIDHAEHSIEPMSALKAGSYRAAARLFGPRTRSDWREEAGHLYSEPVTFTITADETAEVDITLTHRTTAMTWPANTTAELVEIRSALLSVFRKRDTLLRAAVVKPADFDPERTYAAIYEVPGYGGDHLGAIPIARRRAAATSRGNADDDAALHANTFWIVLDPESPNGHTLFADSANNGPCGRALVEELIPELEKRYPLIARPEARLLRGHSSGGWSSLWLALTYPKTFGATWSTSPDPVDFRRLQLVDIYSRANLYTNPPGSADRPGTPPFNPDPAAWPGTPSYRAGDRVLMTVQQECRAEDILGPNNTSAQQWDSWFAVFGPRGDDGHPAALVEPVTGVIDRTIAEQYRRYDIAHLLRSESGRFAPIFRGNVRLLVGEQDNFYLNEAVALLKADLDRLDPTDTDRPAPIGYVKILPNHDHGSIFTSPELRAFPSEMLAHLRRHDLIPASKP